MNVDGMGYFGAGRCWIQFSIAAEQILDLSIRRICRRRAIYALRQEGARGTIKFTKPVVLPNDGGDYTVIAAEQP